MRSYRVLFIDDEVGYYDQVAPLMDEIDGLEIVHARSQTEALDAIERGFFQLALVDVSLAGRAQTDTDGLFVLERLAEVRPTCERVLFTSSIGGDDRHQALQSVAPPHRAAAGLVSGYVNKADPALRASELIRERAEDWLAHPVTIHGMEPVLARLLANEVRGVPELSRPRGHLPPNRDELDHVLSALFGQGLVGADQSVDMVSELELHEMSEGWSRAVTVWCEPRSANGNPGPRCVLKIGPRDDTKQEVARYRAYVRYRLRLRHRVELLDWCIGDTIGAVCYSHNETADAAQLDLQSMIDQEDPKVFDSVKQLFTPEQKQWLADVSDDVDMAKFFEAEYSRPMMMAVTAVRKFVESQPDLSIEENGTVARSGAVRMRLPTPKVLGSHLLTGPFKGCIVHGDLHGGNVLMTADGHPVLIDYRNMARGPRLLDFASLEVSLRMTRRVCDRGVDQLVTQDLHEEAEAWRSDWPATIDPGPDAPFWRRLSSEVRWLAQQNFADATDLEYAATCLLRALRVFMAKAPDDAQRLRLLVWIAVLTEVVEGELDGG